MDLGARIAGWRKAKGLTQQALAKAVGVTYAAVYQWECDGKHRTTPSTTSIAKIADALGISVERFYGRIPTKRTAA